jgi:hypothetical protein
MFQDIIHQFLRNTVVFDIEEADIFTDFPYEMGSGPSVAFWVPIGLEVDHLYFCLHRQL